MRIDSGPFHHAGLRVELAGHFAFVAVACPATQDSLLGGWVPKDLGSSLIGDGFNGTPFEPTGLFLLGRVDVLLNLLWRQLEDLSPRYLPLESFGFLKGPYRIARVDHISLIEWYPYSPLKVEPRSYQDCPNPEAAAGPGLRWR